MFSIILICTRHEEHGSCNSLELLKIIESIKPEVIFEELSYANFDKCYHENTLTTLETNAIKIYLLNHNIKHIPVDTYNLPRTYDEEVESMYNKILNNNLSVESNDLRRLIDKQMFLVNQYGFSFLNSNENDELFEQFNTLNEKIISILNSENLFRIYKLDKEIKEKREDEILNNIYNYSRDHNYNKAILFIGSGHRKSMIRKIEDYKLKEKIILNWTVYNSAQ